MALVPCSRCGAREDVRSMHACSRCSDWLCSRCMGEDSLCPACHEDAALQDMIL